MAQIILNFHGVGAIPRTLDPGERNCWLDQDHFEAVLDIVCGQPHVQITFDDGNVSDFEAALPALLCRNLRATFFVCSGRLDQPCFLSRVHIQELITKGMSIGSHGMDHVNWRHLALDHLLQEVKHSRRTLEQVCDRPVDIVACPFGAYDRRVLGVLQQAGYRRVYTSDGGTVVASQWILSRNTVTRSMPPGDLQRLIHHGAGVLRQSSIDVRKFFKRLR